MSFSRFLAGLILALTLLAIDAPGSKADNCASGSPGHAWVNGVWYPNCTLPAADLNSAFATVLPLAGGTMTGKLVLPASTVSAAGLNIPQGTAPTVPVNGDIWTTSAGMYAQINGSTVGPFGVAGAAGITSLTCNGGLTGGVITTTGTCSLNNPTAHGVLIGEGTSAIAATAAGSSGQLLMGQGAADPLWKTMIGDGTIDNLGTLSVTGISHISSGVLSAAHGGAGSANGILKADGAGNVSAATACTDYAAISGCDNTFAGVQNLGAGSTITPEATPATNETGYLGSPENTQNGAYGLVMTDAGKLLYHTSVSAHTYTIPANASVAFPIGTTILISNESGAGAVTIAITSDTLEWGSSTGSRTLAANGTATLIKVAATIWRLVGDGIS